MYLRLIPLFMATFTVGTTTSVIVGLVHVISDDLGVSIAATGQLTAIFALVYAISAPVVGALTSAMNRRYALLVALGILILGSIATALAPNYAIAMVARGLTAIGAATINSTASAASAEIAPIEKRGKALAFVMAGLATASAIGLPFGTLVGAQDWRFAFWGIAAIGVAAAVGVFLTVRLPGPGKLSLADRLRPLKDGWVVKILLVTLLTATGSQTLYTYVGVAATGATGGSQPLLSALFVAGGIGSIVGTALIGVAVDRLPAIKVMITGLCIIIVALLLSPLALSNIISAFAWFVIWGMIGFSTIIPQQQRLLGYAPALAPMLLGLNSGTIYAGLAVGAATGGVLQQWVPIEMLGLPAAVFTVSALLLTLSQYRKGDIVASKTTSPPR